MTPTAPAAPCGALLCASWLPFNFSELSVHVPDDFDQVVNALCLKVWVFVIAVTGNYSTVTAEFRIFVQGAKVVAIQRENDAILGHANPQNI